MTKEGWSSNADENGEVKGFMCMIDWQYELGAAADGNKVYPSIKALKEAHSCAEDCGIVEVAVRFVSVAHKQNPDY